MYVPVDPLPGIPFGQSLCSSAVFPVLFSLSLLHDLRRVVSQQGYPRLDIEVVMEKLVASMPADLRSDPVAGERWIKSVIKQVSDSYTALEPDDAYVHTDVTKVNRPVGTVDSSSLGAIDGLMAALDRQAVRSLKTMPLLFGINEATSETHANRQWEVHVAGVKALQHMCEGLLERLFTLALQAQGVQSHVRWRFAELRGAELLRDEQVRALKLRNAALAYALGYISQDEAAQWGAEMQEADEDEPRIPNAGIGGGGSGGAATANPEPGAGRQRLRDVIDRIMTTNGATHGAR